MKKILMALMSAILCFSLVACNNGNGIDEKDVENALNELDKGGNKKKSGECNPFEDISVTFEGYSPSGIVKIKNTKSGITYTPDKSRGLKNGDTVTIKAESKYYKLTKEEEEYTVSDLPEYVQKLASIPKETDNKLQKNSTDVIKASAADWHEGNKIKDIKLLGCYLLTKKDENTSSEYNQIYYVYKITSEVKGLKRGGDGQTEEVGNENYYLYVKYEDLILLEDGTCSVDSNRYEMTHNTIESDYGRENFIFDYYKYRGYKDLDSLFNDCVTKQLDKYEYESNVKK